MITATQIEEVIANLEQGLIENDFAFENQGFWQYINSASFKGLTVEEHKLLFFINSVIFHSFKAAEISTEEKDLELFQKIEDENWEIHQDINNWEATKNKFFEDYEEEDLLAFVEDMTSGDDNTLSDLGQEVIFITSKTYIDFLLRQNN